MARKDGSTLLARSDEEEVEVVRVYVRLCKDEIGNHRENCRELRFRVPHGVAQVDLLAEGFAIDGNSATKGVLWDGHTRLTISDELRFAQLRLIEWLGERGYEAQFE